MSEEGLGENFVIDPSRLGASIYDASLAGRLQNKVPFGDALAKASLDLNITGIITTPDHKKILTNVQNKC